MLSCHLNNYLIVSIKHEVMCLFGIVKSLHDFETKLVNIMKWMGELKYEYKEFTKKLKFLTVNRTDIKSTPA